MLLLAFDYLGSGGAGLLIATQKLISEDKIDERERRDKIERRGVLLVKLNRKAKGRQKPPMP